MHYPLEPICIHGLSTCTFPVQVIIYIKHYLYSCKLRSLKADYCSNRTATASTTHTHLLLRRVHQFHASFSLARMLGLERIVDKRVTAIISYVLTKVRGTHSIRQLTFTFGEQNIEWRMNARMNDPVIVYIFYTLHHRVKATQSNTDKCLLSRCSRPWPPSVIIGLVCVATTSSPAPSPAPPPYIPPPPPTSHSVSSAMLAQRVPPSE